MEKTKKDLEDQIKNQQLSIEALRSDVQEISLVVAYAVTCLGAGNSLAGMIMLKGINHYVTEVYR